MESKLTIEKTRSAGSRIVSAAAFLVFLAAVIYLTIEMERNSFLEQDLRKEKLHAEALLSEKLSLEKDLLKLRPVLEVLESEGISKDRQLADAAQALMTMRRDAVQWKKAAHALMDSLKQENRQLQVSQEDLAETVSFLMEENKKLREALKQQRPPQ